MVVVAVLASAAGASAAAAAGGAAAATALRTAGWSCSVCFFLFLPTLLRKLHGDGCYCTEPSEKFRVRPRYDYEKKHVSRDSKMCCCCCRFCCGAPTKEYTYPYSMMHRRSTTAGIEVAPHYHQLLVYRYSSKKSGRKYNKAKRRAPGYGTWSPRWSQPNNTQHSSYWCL